METTTTTPEPVTLDLGKRPQSETVEDTFARWCEICRIFGVLGEQEEEPRAWQKSLLWSMFTTQPETLDIIARNRESLAAELA